jgi:hypothetical protein
MRVIKLSNKGVINWLEENRNSRRRDSVQKGKEVLTNYTYSDGRHSLIGQLINDTAGVDLAVDSEDNGWYVDELDIRAPARAVSILENLEGESMNSPGSSWGTIIKAIEVSEK